MTAKTPSDITKRMENIAEIPVHSVHSGERTRGRTATSSSYILASQHAAFFGSLALVVLSAIPFGSVTPLFKTLIVFCICVFALISGTTRALAGTFSISHLRLAAPLCGVLILAAVQIWLPIGGGSLSYDPLETKMFLVVLAGLILFGELLLTHSTTATGLKWIMAAVLVTGASSAVFGLLREFVFDDPGGLLASLYPPETGYAEFYNRNHFVVLIEMAFGLTLGLLLRGKLAERFQFAGWALSALFIYTAIAANSRGGLISVAGMCAVAAFIHFTTKGRGSYRTSSINRTSLFRRITVGAAFAVLVLVAAIFTIAFVGGDPVAGRVEKLSGEVEYAEQTQTNRLAIWRSTVRLIEEHPIVGVGFGAYGAAIPRFDDSNGRSKLEQAHNDYLELAASGGVLGCILFAIFGYGVVKRGIVNFRSVDTLASSSSFGALIGISGVMIHSFVDFGLHVMVNALTFTVLVVIAANDFSAGDTTRPDMATWRNNGKTR